MCSCAMHHMYTLRVPHSNWESNTYSLQLISSRKTNQQIKKKCWYQLVISHKNIILFINQ